MWSLHIWNSSAATKYKTDFFFQIFVFIFYFVLPSFGTPKLFWLIISSLFLLNDKKTGVVTMPFLRFAAVLQWQFFPKILYYVIEQSVSHELSWNSLQVQISNK